MATTSFDTKTSGKYFSKSSISRPIRLQELRSAEFSLAKSQMGHRMTPTSDLGPWDIYKPKKLIKYSTKQAKNTHSYVLKHVEHDGNNHFDIRDKKLFCKMVRNSLCQFWISRPIRLQELRSAEFSLAKSQMGHRMTPTSDLGPWDSKKSKWSQ